MVATQHDLEVMHGIDRSRRIAWARFYQVEEDNARLLRHNRVLLTRLAELVVAISESEALSLLDTDDEVLRDARSILVSLNLSPRGRVVLDEVMTRRRT